jgi:hypothetical protein
MRKRCDRFPSPTSGLNSLLVDGITKMQKEQACPTGISVACQTSFLESTPYAPPLQRRAGRSGGKPNYPRTDVEAVLPNLIQKGLVVAREDINGKVAYFATELAPPLEPFELESYRRKSK